MPGSPEWDLRSDTVGRSMRLINDGLIDREGVSGLAHRLGYSPRHVHRTLVEVLGVGPLTLARAQRAHNARVLLETTGLAVTEVAFAAGFNSVRQFNATIVEVFGRTPSEVRTAAPRHPRPVAGALELRLAHRAPADLAALFEFLSARAVPSVEEYTTDGTYRRSLRLPFRAGVVELRPERDHVKARLWLEDLRDLPSAVQRCRHLLDLDADPAPITDLLGRDRLLAPLVARRPGLRVAGCVDGFELAVRAVLGQQVSVRAARTLAGRLALAHGTPLAGPVGAVVRLFPDAATLAGLDPDDLPMPRSRARALLALSVAVAAGGLDLDRGADRDRASARLQALPGIGPWTVAYVRMRALGDPDAYPAGDLGLCRGLARLGLPGGPTHADVQEHVAGWRPYRSYAAQHLWALAASPDTGAGLADSGSAGQSTDISPIRPQPD